MLQFSLRTLLLLLIPAAAVVAVAVREGEPWLVHTGDPFDLAIAGRGYFCVTAKFGENQRYTRGGNPPGWSSVQGEAANAGSRNAQAGVSRA